MSIYNAIVKLNGLQYLIRIIKNIYYNDRLFYFVNGKLNEKKEKNSFYNGYNYSRGCNVG